MANKQRETMMRKVEQHLRTTSRQLIKIDTEEEALQYLSDSFRAKLYCDFVGVIFTENNYFVPKTWSGNAEELKRSFPLKIDKCVESLIHKSMTDKEVTDDHCEFFNLLKETGVKTWFTVPLHDETNHYGFCIIGFLSYVPLLEMGKHFDEFGQDVAVAISMTRDKEKQLKKIQGIEWITKNLSIDSPVEQSIADLTERAGIRSNAESAGIYLYNDKTNCFIFQPPSYGVMKIPEKVLVENNNELSEYFPYLEKAGGTRVSIPISMELKTIGVLYVEGKRDGVFTEDDVKTLTLLSNHIATILDNTRLYRSEKEHRTRLRFLLDYQQALVKETVKHEDFDGITSMLAELFNESVVLFDRFMRPISFKIEQDDKDELLLRLTAEAEAQKRKSEEFTVLEEDGSRFCVWPISGGDDLVGYLAVQITVNELDEYDQLTIEMAKNICSVQFIKQKLVLDTREQAKDSFVSMLLVENIENEKSILQYANLFQWDLYRPHRVALLSILLADSEIEGSNLLERQAKKSAIWSYIKVLVVEQHKEILAATYNDQYLLIVPVDQENDKESWINLYREIKEASMKSGIDCYVLLGIGGQTELIQDYYESSEQANQALKIVENRYREQGYAFFEELGSYTILHHLEHLSAIDLFLVNQLGPLEKYSEGKNIDLIHTLRTYLQNNGNAKSTADELYLHRSSLLYRLEKIEQLLQVDLNDSEVRFNLMMAFKIYDMRGQSQ